MKRHEFAGKMAGGGVETGVLDVILDVDQLGRSAVRGFVLGNNATASELSRVMCAAPGHVSLVSVPSADPEAARQVFRSNTVRMRRVESRSVQGHVESGPTGVVCEFECSEVFIDHRYEVGDRSTAGEAHYWLKGTLPDLEVHQMFDQKFDGNVEVRTDGSHLEFPADFPWVVELRPVQVYDKLPEKVRGSTGAWMLVLWKTVGERRSLSDEDLAAATAVVEDLLLLASFAAKQWIVWFRRSFGTETGHTDISRATRKVVEEERWPGDGPIGIGHARQFLLRAVPVLPRLRAAGLDLLMPLAMEISSHEEMYAEQRFAMLFMALEKLKDQFATAKELEVLVTKKQFSKVDEALRIEIDRLATDGLIETTKVDAMKEKVPELNRQPLWRVLDALFAAYGVEWRDLYPPKIGSRPPFIGIRNKMFHTAKDVSLDRIVIETERVQAIVQRLLLKMLEWHDLSRVPGALSERMQGSLGD